MRVKAVPLPLHDGSSSTAATPAHSSAPGSTPRKSARRGLMMVPPLADALACRRCRRLGSFCGEGGRGAQLVVQS
jgi:hypothetical protein